MAAVRIASLPANGTLLFSGSPVNIGQIVTTTVMAGNLLVFRPNANANGAGYGNFTFQVQDNGGTANGGVDSANAATLTVNVTGVNDAPVGQNGPSVAETAATPSLAADFGFTDPSDSPANNFLWSASIRCRAWEL